MEPVLRLPIELAAPQGGRDDQGREKHPEGLTAVTSAQAKQRIGNQYGVDAEREIMREEQRTGEPPEPRA